MRPLTVREVAERLGVHPNTVKRIHPEDLPYFRIGERGDIHDDEDGPTLPARVRAGLRELGHVVVRAPAPEHDEYDACECYQRGRNQGREDSFYREDRP